MTDENELNQSTRTSQGHPVAEGKYLDSHFAAARSEYEAMARFAGFQPGWSILDAGAGGGSFIPILSDIVGAEGSIEALDIAAENVEMIQARVQSGEFGCSVKVQVSGVTSLPYDDNRFDAIWCANVFQYLTDAEVAKTLAEFKRVVRPGGLIAVKDSDFSATLIGSEPFTFWHCVEQARAYPEFAIHFQGLLRIPQLPNWYKQMGLALISYKTFLIEWRHPLRESDRPYLETVTPLQGMVAGMLDLPENERAFWHRFTNPEAPDYFLNSPDFYYREAFAVVVGQVPDIR